MTDLGGEVKPLTLEEKISLINSEKQKEIEISKFLNTSNAVEEMEKEIMYIYKLFEDFNKETVQGITHFGKGFNIKPMTHKAIQSYFYISCENIVVGFYYNNLVSNSTNEAKLFMGMTENSEVQRRHSDDLPSLKGEELRFYKSKNDEIGWLNKQFQFKKTKKMSEDWFNAFIDKIREKHIRIL